MFITFLLFSFFLAITSCSSYKLFRQSAVSASAATSYCLRGTISRAVPISLSAPMAPAGQPKQPPARADGEAPDRFSSISRGRLPLSVCRSLSLSVSPSLRLSFPCIFVSLSPTVSPSVCLRPKISCCLSSLCLSVSHPSRRLCLCVSLSGISSVPSEAGPALGSHV